MGSSLVLNRRPKVPAEDTAAFGAIAERFRRAGALEQAVSLCRDGLKKFPDHVSARVTLGWSLLDLGKYDEARVELEQVMRRAPDNLAAIRGLAELHDRFEHTLNLPMDGPGQWPPPAESVDGEAMSDHAPTLEVADADASSQFEVQAAAPQEPVFSEAAMAPAAMGLPLWTPEPASSPVAEAASASVTPSGSGMSSIREIDAFAGAAVPVVVEEDIQFEIDAPVVATAAHGGVTETKQEEIDLALDIKPDATLELARDLTVDVGPDLSDELSVTDDALAALIAEAESLDAAAAMEVVAAPDTLEMGSVEVELDTAAPLDTIELEPADTMGLDLAVAASNVEAVAEPIVEAVAEPIVEAVAETNVEAFAEPVVEAFAEPNVEAVAEPSVEPVLEAALEMEPAIELESAIESEVVAQVADVIAFTARPAAAAESVELEPMELLQDEQEEPVSVIAMPSKSAATVVALERMLRRVQARRRQLMAESVA